GGELSFLASRYADRVAGLVYLDAGYSYAYYDQSRGDFGIDLLDLQRKLVQLQPGANPRNPQQLVDELLATTLPSFERHLRDMQRDGTSSIHQSSTQMTSITQAIMMGMRKYTNIPVSVLAIFAVPHAAVQPFKDDKERAAADARDEATSGAQVKAFESGVPS